MYVLARVCVCVCVMLTLMLQATKKVYDRIYEDFNNPASGVIPPTQGRRHPPPPTRVVRLEWPNRSSTLGPNGQPLPFLQAPAASPAMSFFSDFTRPFSSTSQSAQAPHMGDPAVSTKLIVELQYCRCMQCTTHI